MPCTTTVSTVKVLPEEPCCQWYPPGKQQDVDVSVGCWYCKCQAGSSVHGEDPSIDPLTSLGGAISAIDEGLAVVRWWLSDRVY